MASTMRRIFRTILPLFFAIQFVFSQIPTALKVNPETGGAAQYFPAVTELSDGTLLVAFWDHRRGTEIWAQKYSPAGQKIGKNFCLIPSVKSTDTENWFRLHSNKNGEFALVWMEGIPSYSKINIFVQKFQDDGTALTGRINVSGDTTGTNNYPTVILNEDGTMYCVWNHETIAPGGIYTYEVFYKPLNSDGTPSTDKKLLRSSGKSIEALAAGSGNNDIVIAWAQYDSAYVERRDSTGTLVWSPILFNQSKRFIYTFDFDVNTNGDIAITWYQYSTPWEGYVRLFDKNGIPQWDQLKFRDLTGTSYFGYRKLALDLTEDGVLTAAWTEPGVNTTSVWIQQIQNDGTPITSKEKISDNANNPAIFVTGTNLVTVWNETREEQQDVAMYMKPTLQGGQPSIVSRINDDVDGDVLVAPRIAVNNKGEFVVGWENTGGYRPRINNKGFIQRFTSSRMPDNSATELFNSSSLAQLRSIAVTDDGTTLVSYGGSTPSWGRFGGVLIHDFKAAETLGPFAISSDYSGKGGGAPELMPYLDGTFFLAWYDLSTNPGRFAADIFLQQFSAQGEPISPLITVNDDTLDLYRSSVNLAGNKDGNIVVCWMNGFGNGVDYTKELHLQFFDSTGKRLGSNLLLDTHFSDSPSGYSAFVGFDESNIAHVVWEINGGNIFTQRVDPLSGPIGEPFIVPRDEQTSSLFGLRFAMDKTGKSVVIWNTKVGDTYRAYGQRFNQNGEPIGNNFSIGPTSPTVNVYSPSVALQNNDIYLVWADDSDSEYSGNYDIWATVLNFETLLTGTSELPNTIPSFFTLSQNYPNPFNPSTMIRYSVPSRSRVNLKIFNVLGQEVSTLVNKESEAGTHQVRWDATGLPSGMYFYRLTAGQFNETKKLVLTK